VIDLTRAVLRRVVDEERVNLRKRG
jgi:hypothetical protein